MRRPWKNTYSAVSVPLVLLSASTSPAAQYQYSGPVDFFTRRPLLGGALLSPSSAA